MELQTRKLQRLQEFDYRVNGAYFVTACTKTKEPLFGHICRGDPCGRPPIPAYVIHNPLGEIACNTFSEMESIYPITIPAYVVMPDHVHFIVLIHNVASHFEAERKVEMEAEAKTEEACAEAGANIKARATARVAPTLGRIVGGYKSKVYTQWLARCKREKKMAGSVWQRGYYDHIIRNSSDYQAITHYIANNPARWVEKYPYLCT